MQHRNPIQVGGLVCVLVLTGCSAHHTKLTTPTVHASGPIISATPKPSGATSPPPSGAEGASTEAEAPCPLAAASTISTAFGARIAAQNLSSIGKTGSTCQIKLASSNLGPGITLSLSRNSPVSGATFSAAKQAALAHGAESVSGIGQDAYYTPAAHNLQYRSGSAAGAFGVTSTNPGALTALAGQVRADLIALARAAVASQ